MPMEWNLHFSSELIADGEPHVKLGQSLQWFAVEFWAEKGLAVTDERLRSAIPIADFQYQVVAELAYVSKKACVIDFGLKAIGPTDALPPGCKAGDCVSGQIGIGLPLCTEIVPEDVSKALEHNWRVNRISADLTPYVARGPLCFVRDESQIRYGEVRATDAVEAKHTSCIASKSHNLCPGIFQRLQ